MSQVRSLDRSLREKADWRWD